MGGVVATVMVVVTVLHMAVITVATVEVMVLVATVAMVATAIIKSTFDRPFDWIVGWLLTLGSPVQYYCRGRLLGYHESKTPFVLIRKNKNICNNPFVL